MTRKWIWLAAACGAIALAGGCNCGNPEPTPNPNEDAGGGGGNDAGVENDAGNEMDAGNMQMDGGETDAGMEMDGGQMDAGMEMDGGMMGMDAGMDAGVTPTSVCADVAKKKCDFWIRCHTDTDAEPRFGANGTANQGRANDEVTSQMRADCEKFETDFGCRIGAEGWSKGRATLDQSKYNACIDSLYPPATCARDLNAVLSECVGAPYVTGTTANGSLCVADSECANGFCAKTGTNTCGICTAFVATGQQCPNGNECNKTTAFCNPFAGNTCTAYTATGQQCFTDTQCGPGNVCHLPAGGGFNRVCAAGVPKGGACLGRHFDCARTPDPNVNAGQLPELICSTNMQGVAGTCIEIQSAVGGSCGTGERVTNTTQVQGPICNETEFCVAALCTPRRTAGQPCASSDQCVNGTYCDMNAMPAPACAAYKDVNQACASSAQCKNFMLCGTTATCQPILASLGAACNANVPCAEGYCDTGTNMCTALKADGTMCTGNGQCDSGSCVMGMCAAACWQ